MYTVYTKITLIPFFFFTFKKKNLCTSDNYTNTFFIFNFVVLTSSLLIKSYFFLLVNLIKILLMTILPLI